MLPHLLQGLRQLGIELTPGQLDSFETYRAELLEWNQRMNLTSITEPAEMEIRHFLDSLTVLYALPQWRQAGRCVRIIDVGTGAGFPGVPLKLLLPDADMTLLEATGKKTAFLTHLVTTLGLSGVRVVQGRAEDAGHSVEHRERYDVAVARAVAPLPALAEYCLPFVCSGGLFVALKKGDLSAELRASRAAFRILGGGEARLMRVPLEQLADDRYLVCSTKESATPSRYPRRAGMPARHPL